MSYPTLRQSSDSKEVRINGREIDRASNLAVRGRSFGNSEKKRFTVIHPRVTSSDKATLEAFYAANSLNSFAFTWAGDGIVYTCIFGATDPDYTPLPGGLWKITMELLQV